MKKIYLLLSVFLLLTVYTMQAQQVVNTNTQGTHDGYFYSFWEENNGNQASMTLYPGGRYTTTWNNVGNFTAGKGWAVGSKDRVVCFEGSYDGGSNGFLAVYGWTKDPLIEYYVVESHGDWDPPGNTSDIQHLGSFTSDGGVYDIYTSLRVDKPSIIGTATFEQYWSVRRTKRATGTVTFANHVNEWEKYGVVLGTTWDYQIMESEGYGSSGSSDITVWECESCSADPPTVANTEINYMVGDTPSQLSATGSNLMWYTSASLTNGSTTAPTPSTATKGSTTYYVTQTPSDCESQPTEIVVNVRVPQGPYNGTPHPIPGTIEAEEYDEGGNDFAYYDDSPGSEVTPVVNYRTDEDVDIENCEDTGGGYNLGYTTAGEWLEYTVDVNATGEYELELRLACAEDNRTLSIDVGGQTIANAISVPNTGGWQTWQTVTVSGVQLTAGEQIMRITIGAQDYVNINYVTYTAVATTTPPEVSITSPSNNDVFNTPVDITIEAEASDSDGNVDNVEFFYGNTSLGSDATSPYSITWSNVPVGTHSLTAVATDNEGSTSTSEVVIINVIVPQGPYNGTAHSIPGTIQLEEYDVGGNGSAYYDDTPGSETGVAFRNDEDVDIEESTDTGAGYNIGWATEGEWLEYTVDVTKDGTYDLEVRYAIGETGSRDIHIEMDGVNLTGTITLANTGGWQTWETFTVTDLDLTAGQKIMRLSIDADYVNLNYVTFTAQAVVDSDNDGTPDVSDACPNDPNKAETEGYCGCGATEESCLDCAGTPNGDAFYDNCNDCVVSDDEACTQDCNDEWGGTAAEDVCGTCAGGSTGIDPVTNPQDCIATGIDEDYLHHVKIYPNPTTGILHLPETTSWRLIDMQGTLLLEGNEKLLDLTNFKEGLYILNMDGEMIKVVKK